MYILNFRLKPTIIDSLGRMHYFICPKTLQWLWEVTCLSKMIW